MAEELGVFETIYSMRAMRRLRSDPVPLEMIRKILDAGIRAPSGMNFQAWEFIILQNRDNKKFFQEHYYQALLERLGEQHVGSWSPEDQSPQARLLRPAIHLAEHMHEVPILLLVCGKRDWPFVVPKEKRLGKAPPSYGSVFPCVQNILLACRALGLGASLTTMHQMFEGELCQRIGIPEEYGIVAVIPIGFPEGKFGPVKRRPAPEVTHFDQWGQREPTH